MSAAASSPPTTSRSIRRTGRAWSCTRTSAKSPWIDPADLQERGAVVVWEDGQLSADDLARLRSTYPGLAVQEPLSLKRRTWARADTARPVRVHYALVPPRP